MKKVILSLLAFLYVMAANAQLNKYSNFTVFEGNHFWVEAGAIYGKVTSKHADFKIGYRAGVGADIPIYYSSVSFLPTILFENKGYKGDMIINSVTKTHEETDLYGMYIEVPLDFSFNVPIGKRAGFQLYAGPCIGIGVAGKYTASSDDYTGLYGQRTQEFKTFEEVPADMANVSKQMRRFDFAIDAGVRFIFLRYAMVKLGVEVGCINANAVPEQPAFRNFSMYGGLAFRY